MLKRVIPEANAFPAPLTVDGVAWAEPTSILVAMWLFWVGSETHHIMLPLFLLSPHLAHLWAVQLAGRCVGV